jgi:serine protease Do
VLRIIDAAADVPFKPITFGDPTKLKKGQIVVVLGNPYAIARDGQASASWGIIANLSRKAGPNKADDPRDRKDTLHHFGTLIQTDAKLNLGTSGGALVNLKGEMIGLTTSQAAVAGFEQAAGYAIPCDDVFRRVIDTLKQGKEVEYGLLGIELRPLGPVEAAAGLRGARVTNVLGGMPAERAGILRDDVITQVAGKPIHDVDGLMLQVGRQPAAADTTITVARDGRLFNVAVTLAKYEVRGKKVVTAPDPGWRGLRVDFPSAHRELNPQFNLQFEFRLPTIDPAVLSIDVAEDSPAWRAGLRRGMLITHVRNVPVGTPKEFQAQVAALRGDVELRIAPSPGQPPVVKVPAK